jgi:hypothetical protein
MLLHPSKQDLAMDLIDEGMEIDSSSDGQRMQIPGSRNSATGLEGENRKTLATRRTAAAAGNDLNR